MNFIRNIMQKYREAKTYASKELYWEALARKVSPVLVEEFPDYLRIDKNTVIRSIVIGVPHFGNVGYPKILNARLIDELLGLSAAGFTIAYSFTGLPIDANGSFRVLDHAL